MNFIKNYIKKRKYINLYKIAFSKNHKDKSKALDELSVLLGLNKN